MADQDYGTCDDCGKPLSEDDAQADFDRRADMIYAALDGADWETTEALLAMFTGLHLSGFDPVERKKARRGIIRVIDEETRDCVIRACDA